MFARGCWGGVEAIRGWLRLNLTLGHDGGCAAGFALFVDLAVHDLDALEIFLNDFFPGEFDVLFGFPAGPVAHPVDHVLLDHHADLFCEVGSGREFRDPLADHLAFAEIALAFSDEVLVFGVMAIAFRDRAFAAGLLVGPTASLCLVQLLE